MIPPSGGADHRVVGPPDGEARRVRDERGGERRPGRRALHVQLAHVRQVEQPDPLADGPVLLDDRAVLDRHQPAAELDQPRPEVASGGRSAASGGPAARPPRSRAARSRPSRRRPAGSSRDGAAGRATSARSVSNVSIVGRLGEGDPADLVELVVVAGQVAAGRLHQEVVDGLVDARARTGRTSTRSSRAGR